MASGCDKDDMWTNDTSPHGSDEIPMRDICQKVIHVRGIEPLTSRIEHNKITNEPLTYPFNSLAEVSIHDILLNG